MCTGFEENPHRLWTKQKKQSESRLVYPRYSTISGKSLETHEENPYVPGIILLLGRGEGNRLNHRRIQQ